MDQASHFTQQAARVWRARAPLRLDLAGGWTDVAPFSLEEGGAVCSVALQRYQQASFQAGGTAVRLQSGARALAGATLDALPADDATAMLAAALRRKGITGPCELLVQAGAPPGSGLGSSGALGVALLGLLNAVLGATYDPAAVALEAYRLEVDDLGIPGGLQDQFTAALGGFLLLEFGATVQPERLQLAPGLAELLAERLVLCYGGKARLSGDIIAAVRSSYQARRPETCDALRSMKALAYAARAALLAGDAAALGEILAANWRAQQQLHPSVSNPDLERLFSIATAAGARGGKALGAGGGGCLVFYCPDAGADNVQQALRGAGAEVWPVAFDRIGLRVTSEHGRNEAPNSL